MILSDVCEFIVDCPHSTAPDEGEGYPLIRTPNVGKGRLDLNGVHRVSESVYKQRIQRGAPRANDLIFAREAPAGNVALVQENQTVCLGQRTVLIRPNVQKVNPQYLVYYLLSPKPQYELLGTANGATVAHVNLPAIRNLKIELPEKSVQDKIGTILVTYDDLIENNQKQIKLLEEAAQRLYKEWFVDLRFPGYENTKIVDGVPEGWQYEKLGDLVKTTSGGTPSRRKSEYYVNGNIRWIKTKELNDRFIFETEEHITEDAVKNSSAKVLPEGALIVAMYGATIGKIGITAAEMACNQACCAFISFDDMISKEYLYCWLMDNREYLVSQGKGAAQSNLSQEMIRNFSLLCPDKKVIKNFTEIVTTMLENKRVLENKILMLSKARDDLLPKLMSGEVEV